jgi:hypothetical protein
VGGWARKIYQGNEKCGPIKELSKINGYNFNYIIPGEIATGTMMFPCAVERRCSSLASPSPPRSLSRTLSSSRWFNLSPSIFSFLPLSTANSFCFCHLSLFFS